jgi:predicted XRE-type DNA-binding protein
MTERPKIERGSGNVFRDIGFSPEEAQNLQLRSDLTSRIERFVKRSGMTRAEAARSLGVGQRGLNDLLRGKIDKFSLDALVSMLGHAGMRVELKVKKAARRSTLPLIPLE